jgi:hypothetical protein
MTVANWGRWGSTLLETFERFCTACLKDISQERRSQVVNQKVHPSLVEVFPWEMLTHF